MSTRCQHRKPENGDYCKNWAMKGSLLCSNHLRHPAPPLPPLPSYAGMTEEQIVAALKAEAAAKISPPETCNDVVSLVSRAMADALEGRIAPAQAYAVGFLGEVWLRASKKRYKANKAAMAERASEETWKVSRPVFERAASDVALPNHTQPSTESSAPVPEPGPVEPNEISSNLQSQTSNLQASESNLSVDQSALVRRNYLSDCTAPLR